MRYRSGLLVLALGVLAGVATPPDWQARYGDAWARIAEAYASYPPEREGSRAVGVHGLGILEALRKIYRADALVREIIGTT